MMEKSAMEKEVVRLANKLTNATKKFDEEYITVRENLRNEEKSRADHTSRILETRIIGLTEGAEMAQRRAMNDLASFRANEEKVFQAITELNRKKAQLEKESKMLDSSLI